MNDSGLQEIMVVLQSGHAAALLIGANLAVTVAVLVIALLLQNRLRHRQEQHDANAGAAQQALVERLEKLAAQFSETVENLNREIAQVAEDAREARRIARPIPAQLDRIQSGITALQDELVNQSTAKFQTNEAIRNALALGGKAPDRPAGKSSPR